MKNSKVSTKKLVPNKKDSGAVLVTLLVFTVMAVTVTAGAITVSIINAQGTSKLALGEETYHIAEAGIENAIIRILRNPSYTGETIAVGSGSATITVTGAGTLTIISTGTLGDFSRTIEVVGDLSNNEFNLTSWDEI